MDDISKQRDLGRIATALEGIDASLKSLIADPTVLEALRLKLQTSGQTLAAAVAANEPPNKK